MLNEPRLMAVLFGVCCLVILLSLPGWLYVKRRGHVIALYEFGTIFCSMGFWLFLMAIKFGEATFTNLVEVVLYVPIAALIVAYVGVFIRRFHFARGQTKYVSIAVVCLNLLFVFFLRYFMPALAE